MDAFEVMDEALPQGRVLTIPVSGVGIGHGYVAFVGKLFDVIAVLVEIRRLFEMAVHVSPNT